MVARRYGLKINSFSVRKDRKEYGLFHLFEGIPDRNLPVMVIDDTIQSASSAKKVLSASLYEYDLQPSKNLFCVVGLSKTRRHVDFNVSRITINSLYTVNDFDVNYTEEKYFEPFDCDKSFNKMPDYR